MKGEKERPFVHYLAIFGCVSAGIIYIAIGVVAILSFMKIREGGADESSILAILNNSTPGYILVCIILLGTISYIIWRIYECITDPYGFGNNKKGIATRTSIAFSTVPDMLIVYSAVTALFGTSQANENGVPEALRESVTETLQRSGGAAIIITIGIVVLITAIVQVVYGVTKGYRERLDIDHLKKWARSVIHFLGATGYLTRGIILGIISFFFIKAGLKSDAQLVVNTDKAFDFIGDNVGHLWFILAAAGTICYGIFMSVFGVYYDTDRD